MSALLSLAFWYPVVYFFQPGVLYPSLAPFFPLQIISGAVLILHAWPRGQYPRTSAFRSGAFRWMLAFMFIQIISVIREGFASALSEIAYLGPIAEFVLLSILLIDSPRSFQRYVNGMICGCMWIVVYGIYALHAGLRVNMGGLAGAYGNYENHNDYTFCIIQTLPFIYLGWRDSTSKLWRCTLLACLLACLYGTVLSESRGGMIALVIEFVFIVSLTMTKKRRNLFLPVVVVIGLMAVSYQYAIRAESNGEDYTAEDAKTSRFELWYAGKNMLFAHPILGVGNRRFSEQAPYYGELSHDQIGKNSHNTYIEVAATTGVLGLIAFGNMLWRTRKQLRTPILADKTASIDSVRMACLIALSSIFFRAFLDAKDHDWSFYLFVVVASACDMHRRRFDHSEDASPVISNGFAEHRSPPINRKHQHG